MGSLKIYQMSSFSRSGETLLLRCLNAHPAISVVHQLLEPDDPRDMELFRFLMNYPETEISASHPTLAHRQLDGTSVLILKNAVWTHAHPRLGFALARNPFSVTASAFRDAPSEDAKGRQKNQQVRWSKTIDAKMTDAMRLDPTITSFLMLYNRKLLNDRREGLPFVRYEDLTSAPETVLKRLIEFLGLPWTPDILNSHQSYQDGQLGHGKLKLWMPIHQKSMSKFSRMSPSTLAHIYGMTHEVLMQYGYVWNGRRIDVCDTEGLL